MLYSADIASLFGAKVPHPAFAATAWGLRAYVYTDRHVIESPNQTEASGPLELGVVRYYCG